MHIRSRRSLGVLRLEARRRVIADACKVMSDSVEITLNQPMTRRKGVMPWA